MGPSIKLQAAYDDLLRQHGLDAIEPSERAARESHEAMANAGWYDDEIVRADDELERRLSQNLAHHYNPLLAYIAALVENDIRRQGDSLSLPVFVGGFPTGETNACVKLIADGALVLVNHGLIQLIYQISKVFVLSYDWLSARTTEQDDVLVLHGRVPPAETMTAVLGWAPCGWTKQQAITALTAILHAYLHAGTVTQAPRQQLPKHNQAMTLDALVHYAERFLVAHEYAHVLLKHCEGPVDQLPTPVGPIGKVISRTRQQEFEADELATTLLLAGADREAHGGDFDLNARLCGISLLFSAAALRAVALHGPLGLGFVAEGSDDHPTPNERMLRILEFVHRQYDRPDTQLARVCWGVVFGNHRGCWSGVD